MNIIVEAVRSLLDDDEPEPSVVVEVSVRAREAAPLLSQGEQRELAELFEELTHKLAAENDRIRRQIEGIHRKRQAKRFSWAKPQRRSQRLTRDV